jgi:hypothetical protein
VEPSNDLAGHCGLLLVRCGLWWAFTGVSVWLCVQLLVDRRPAHLEPKQPPAGDAVAGSKSDPRKPYVLALVELRAVLKAKAKTGKKLVGIHHTHLVACGHIGGMQRRVFSSGTTCVTGEPAYITAQYGADARHRGAASAPAGPAPGPREQPRKAAGGVHSLGTGASGSPRREAPEADFRRQVQGGATGFPGHFSVRPQAGLQSQGPAQQGQESGTSICV